MFLSGTFLGVSSFMAKYSPPTPSEYTKLTIFGESTIGYIQTFNKVLTDAEISALSISATPTWDEYTLMLATFEDNLDAGNVYDLPSNITKWIINRKASDETIYTKIDEVAPSTTSYIDYTVNANKSYTYDIFPATDTLIGSALETDEILADYFGCYLVDEGTGTVYLFDLGLDTGSIKNQTNLVEYETFTKYNAFSFGDRDFLRGSIKALGGYIDVNGNLIHTVDYLDTLRNFINNKTEKILKFRNGKNIRVITSNFDHQYLNEIGDQPFYISFDFVESSEF